MDGFDIKDLFSGFLGGTGGDLSMFGIINKDEESSEEYLSKNERARNRYFAIENAHLRLEKMRTEYIGQFEKLRGSIEKIVKWEQATGGEVLHRGYYNPTLCADIVVGNNKRGKLLKRKSSKSKITYEYGYGADGKMKVAITHTDVGDFFEYFTEIGEKRYGLSYDEKGTLVTLCEEVFENGRIREFTIGYDSYDDHGFGEIYNELFSYSPEGFLLECDIIEVRMPSLLARGAKKVHHTAYEFVSDIEGKLLKYRMCADFPSLYPPTPDDEWFDVKAVRVICYQ